MVKRTFLILVSILLVILPLTAWAASIPAKVFESGSDNTPIAVSGVKVEVLGGYRFKALLFSSESGANGECLLGNVPLGKDVLVRLTKSGYVPQDDVRSYSEADIEQGVILWVGSEANVKGLYSNLGEAFDVKKGHVYLEISDEMTEEGIEGIQLGSSSGKVFDLGKGEYLIANAEGTSVKIGIGKPGYAFDIESATIPLFSGEMTQYYVKVQSGGAVWGGQAAAGVSITGRITRLSDAVGVSGVSVAFLFGKPPEKKGQTARPAVKTDPQGYYRQSGFEVGSKIIVDPSSNFWKFRPEKKTIYKLKETGGVADFKAIPR